MVARTRSLADPEQGASVEEGGSCCEVQVEKVSFDVYAPAAGEIAEVVCAADDEFERGDILAWLRPT